MQQRVLLPEPMLRYRCNQKGCCCTGWDIPFSGQDYLRLIERFDETDRAQLGKKVSFVVLRDGGENVLKELKLDGVGDKAACRFLAEDAQCKIHGKYGIDALPDICANFPVIPYTAKDGRVELFFEPLCPEVLNQIGETDEPLRLVERAIPSGDAGFALRVQNAVGHPVARRGGVNVDAAALNHIRDAVLVALSDFSRPVWETLSAIACAFDRFATGRAPPEEFAITYADDTTPFMAFLHDCISAHGPGLLHRVFVRYRRFIWSLDKDDPRWAALPEHLHAWQPAIETWFEPHEPALRPLLLRYLGVRFFSPFFEVHGELEHAASSIVHGFGSALRFAAALGACRGQPVDKDTMKVAIGLAEFLHRSFNFPKEVLPWFSLASPRGS